MLAADDDGIPVNPFEKRVKLEFYRTPAKHLSRMGITSQNWIRYLLYVFNFVFLLFGLGLIGAGAVARISYGKYLSFLDSGYSSVPIFMIFVGTIIAVVSFFGCCGALRSNFCMVVTFSILLGLLFVFEVSGAIAAYVQREHIDKYLHYNMQVALQNYNVTYDKRVWDRTQIKLGCCGVVNYKDWIRAQTQELPQSCCSVEKFPNGVCNSTLAAVAVCDIPTTNDCPIYVTGCADIILKNIEAHMGGIGGLGIAIAFIEIIGMILSCIFAKRLKSGYTYA